MIMGSILWILRLLATSTALLFVPGIAIGLARRICEVEGVSQTFANAFAMLVVAAMFLIGLRLSRPVPDERMHDPARALAFTALAISAAIALRGAVTFLQMTGVATNSGAVVDFAQLTVVSALTVAMRLALQPAVLEEVAIRAYLQAKVSDTAGSPMGITLSIAAGTIVHWHLDRFWQDLWLFVLGALVLSVLFQLTRSLALVVGVHFLFDISGLVLDYLAWSRVPLGTPIVTAYADMATPGGVFATTALATALSIALLRSRLLSRAWTFHGSRSRNRIG